ncbi:putative hydrolase [Hyaloraphidium curvatum]|nr:putative hydrolase [Hyaloraphidium curvatum]
MPAAANLSSVARIGPFRAVLLDMDGTLVDSDAVVERTWRLWAEEHGMDAAVVLRVAHGRPAGSTMRELLPDRPEEDNVRENAEFLARESVDVEGVVAVPGAPELLEALRRLHVPHALVTSADLKLASARMGAAGLAMPDVRVTAERVGKSKPDPEGFLLAASELGIPPSECVIFEDSGPGITAGKNGGMVVVGVGARAAAQGPTVHVADLRQVSIEPNSDGRFWIAAS